MTKTVRAFLTCAALWTVIPGANAASGYPFGGSGTPRDPYIVTDADDILALADAVAAGEDFSGRHFRLDADLDMSGARSFRGIGSAAYNASESRSFRGEFNGMLHTVSNLDLSAGDDLPVAFFNSLDEGADVHHMRFDASCSVYGNLYAATAAARVWGGRVEYIASDATVTATHYAGGIVSDLRGGTVQSCVNRGEIGATNNLGGIVAKMEGTSAVTGCYNTGVVRSTGTGACAGIAGVGFDNTTITGCYNAGAVYGRRSEEFDIDPAAILSDHPAVIWQGKVEGCCYLSPQSHVTDALAETFDSSRLGSEEALTLLNNAVDAAIGSTADGHADALYRLQPGLNSGYPVLAWESNRPGSALDEILADSATTLIVDGNTLRSADGKHLKIYAPDGRLAAKGAVVTLSPGIYIVSGKKIHIR